MRVNVAFNSMSLPHLTPQISSIKLYRNGTNTEIGKDDAVSDGEIVRVECMVRNAHASAGTEQFPMHLKMIDTTAHPTKGVTPFRNTSYPTQVNGTTVNYDVNGTTGVPLTLVGQTPTKVTYYARVSQVNGAAVTLGQQLIEDSFGGTQESGVELLAAKPLEPAPGTVDPDDPGSDAGRKFHYARFPQPNGNGWNNSPVTVRFYPGDFDQMTLTPSGASAVTLTGASPDWVQAADTAGTALSAQAKNTATGAVSTQKAGTVKIDTTAPRLTLDPALDVLTVDDTAAVASGVWKVHRTDSSGAVAADARAAAFKEFALTSGNGAAKQTVANIPNGWYVAEDAAGNRSAPLKVDATEPPAVERPPGSVVNPDDPNSPTPVGPPVGPGDDVPGPTVSEDAAGLRHAVIEETVSEMIDPAAPPFGGLLEKAEATALMDYRYAASSSAGIASVTDELLDTAGAPLAAFDTKVPGGCLVRRVITDVQGNTTTINLHYQLTRDNCPPVRPLEPVDPADPSGPTQPGEPLTPDGPVTKHPDGTQHTEVTCEVTEAVSRGVMGADGAVALLKRHYAFASVNGGAASATVQSMSRLGGGSVSEIDLSKAADYLITYRVADADGNSTTVKLTYHLVSSRAPGVVVKPDPGTDPNPQPGDDPLNPQPRPLDPVGPPAVHPNGTHHAVVEDEMRVPVEEGVVLSLADVRALMERRYTLTPENPGPLTERSLAVAAASGAPVTAIDRSTPGVFRITYQVADAAGNTVTVRLRYMVVADAPTVTPRPDPDGDGPGGSGDGGDGPGTPDDPAGGRDPLPPTSIVVDPATGLTHAVIEDTVTVATSHEPMTPAAMADLFALRYAVKSTLPDGKLTREPVHLYRGGDFGLSRAGGEVDAIDRSKPGDWRAEQRLVDSGGNTTTIKLTYLVREGSISGSVGDDGNGGNGAGPGDGTGAGNGAPGAGPSAGDGSATSNRWSSFIHQLPQTGGPFGSCPLHILFVLLMVLASAYTLMRLRQESARREQRRQRDAEWEEFRREAVR